ncbi:unnamed protein product [Albugo candida]|nr:unnamed protein product [Albugo candida]|eukprot:CCI50217.1 unnamed protein product [Albugo candida]
MCVPFGIGKVMDLAAVNDIMQIPYVLGGLGCIFAAGSIANILRVHTSNMIGERITNRLRQDTFQSIVKQDLGFFDAAKTGELINRLSADTTLVGTLLSDNMSQGFRSMGQAVGSISMLFVTCPKLGLIMLITVPPLALAGVSYGRFVKSLTSNVQKKLSDATASAEDCFTNVSVVKWFAKEHHEIQKYESRLCDALSLSCKRSKASAAFFGGVDLSVKMSTLAVLGYGGHMVANGLLTTGELTSFMMYTIYVGFSFAGLSQFYSNLTNGIGASTRLFELKHRQPNISALTGTNTLPHPLHGRIKFQDVCFRYPTRPDSQILVNLNLDVCSNESVALVGPSGCGKSTIVALLARFYELDSDRCSGKITLDGIDIATLPIDELRGIIGAVPQEPPLFACSIRENIAYGHQQTPTFEDIVQAAKQANAHEFIMTFHQGYDTLVSERGQSLSGGQKQRLAIARALIKNPKILILDEATSALDQESERYVQETLNKVKKGRTVILIAHRHSTIQSADRIAVISNHTIAEEGTYQEIAANAQSLFRQIVAIDRNAI